VTIKRMGSTKLYSEGWEKAFGKSARRSAGVATRGRKPARGKTRRKAAK
jgi:hypothetical protein